MKAYIGVDVDSGLVHTVTTMPANEADVEQVAELLHGTEEQVRADPGYPAAQARVQCEDLQWHIAARPKLLMAREIDLFDFCRRIPASS